ncbi:PAS domain-containing protein [Azospirillum soli]|uniref:PAS domain-containing protein n=1 Tax=Azospirillum soli TaxID=1304799 RepID=UPI001AEA359C|nr:PAS domain-containing protein [Azospirillum soli]MBP2314410.1 signal transduction histidine kinase/CheY-like chemotaxis protein [Azospirillum soli]
MWLDRARTLQAGERSAYALARVLEEQTARGLQAVDLTLTGIIDALALTPGLGDHAPVFEDKLRERLKSLPQVRALFVIGPDGFITQDTDHPNTPRVTLADRDYFIAHTADPSPMLRISQPLISRSVGAWFISVSRRITRPDGSFGGIAVAAVEPRYFERFYRELTMGERDRIALFRRDGTLLVGTPYDDKAIGKDFSMMELFRTQLPRAADGTYHILSMFDQTPRTISYRSVPGFPLVVAVALAEDDLLAGWRRNATTIAVAAGLVASLIVLLLILRVRRRAEHEHSVRLARKMATVLESTTDAVIEMDRTWRVTFMNERARSLLPHSRDVTGQVFWDSYPELAGTDVGTQFREIMEANAASEFEIVGPLSRRWYFVRAFPSRDGMAVFFQDITARKQAEEERRSLAQELDRERTLLKGVLAHLPSGVFAAAAPEGRLLLHNAMAEQLLDRPVHIAQRVVDYAAYGALHPDGRPYRPEEHPLARALRGKTVTQEEMQYRRGDGTQTTFSASAAPVRTPDGQIVMAVSTFHDISERKRMEEALLRSEEQLNFALASANAGTWDWDIASGELTWSDGTYALYGLPADRFTPTFDAWLPLVQPDDRNRVQHAILAMLDSKSSNYTLENRILHPERGERWLMNVGRITRARDGAPLRLTGISIDITARKRLEEDLLRNQERLREALVAARAGTWDWDVPTGEVFWSEENAALFGLPTGTVPSGYGAWLEAVLPEDRAQADRIIRDALAARKDRYQVEFRVHPPGKEVRWLIAMGRIHYGADGGPVRVSGLNVDNTERRHMEEDLRAAKQEAERASLAKSKFLAAASHDLRQPLQSLFLFAAALHPQVQTERGRNGLEMLERNLEALKGLLDSLFDVSRLDAEVIRPSVEDVSLAPVLDQIGASFAPVAKGKGLDFKVDVPPDVVVRSDRHLLGRMVRNLVENAIKYTEQGSIRLECRIVGGRARIAVHDTGIGIAPDQQELVFMEFHQIANPERDRNKGLGLGLSIVQRLAKLLDHPVSIQSRPGQGSVFSVDVPLGAPHAVRPAEPFAAMTRDGDGRLAVLIDDEADVLLGLQEIVRGWGYDTVIGTSAEQVLERLRADGRTPAVIVTDYRLADLRTGGDAVRLIREQVGVAVPGVILTGDTGPGLRAEATRQGLGIVIKPVVPRQLHEALKKLLGEAA